MLFGCIHSKGKLPARALSMRAALGMDTAPDILRKRHIFSRFYCCRRMCTINRVRFVVVLGDCIKTGSNMVL